MTPALAFDIETIPDCAGIRRILGLPDSLPDAEAAEAAFQRRRAHAGSDFLPPHLQRVVVISCVLREGEGLRIFSLGEPEVNEREAIQRFFDGIERYVPQLVSWNGGGFDLAVLAHRGLVHGVRAAKFWDQGEEDRDFRFNNYVSRYHGRHLDLMDVLALYQPRNNAPLDEMAHLAGLPGKIGLGGAAVWEAWRAGRLAEIRAYCEADTLNTYLLWLRFQLLRGAFDDRAYRRECALARETLGKIAAPWAREFLARWSG